MLRKAAVVAGLSLAFAVSTVQTKGFEALLKGDYAFNGRRAFHAPALSAPRTDSDFSLS